MVKLTLAWAAVNGSVNCIRILEQEDSYCCPTLINYIKSIICEFGKSLLMIVDNYVVFIADTALISFVPSIAFVAYIAFVTFVALAHLINSTVNSEQGTILEEP